jgi:hypothetical protein
MRKYPVSEVFVFGQQYSFTVKCGFDDIKIRGGGERFGNSHDVISSSAERPDNCEIAAFVNHESDWF